jgi:hypothetical protein
MGAEYFTMVGNGATAQEAFEDAGARSAWDPDGYTGNINVKDGFVIVERLEGESVDDAMERMEDSDLVNYKWGPAACIQCDNPTQWMFFGWASS